MFICLIFFLVKKIYLKDYFFYFLFYHFVYICEYLLNKIRNDDIEYDINLKDNNIELGFSDKNSLNKFKIFFSGSGFENSNIKIISNENEHLRRNSINYELKNGLNFSFKKNINPQNNILNNSSKTNDLAILKNEQTLTKKRTRLNSFEGLFNNFDKEL